MGFCLWVTGLPGSGKTTIVNELERMLLDSGIEVITLNLDQLRTVLTPEPKYTDEERSLVYRCLVLTASLLVERAGKSVVIDATGNRRAYRELARHLIPDFAEAYIKCPLEKSMDREAWRFGAPVEKDLYRRAIKGELKGKMPGVTVPYEAPEDPEIQVESDILSPLESAGKIMAYIKSRWGAMLGQKPIAE